MLETFYKKGRSDRDGQDAWEKAVVLITGLVWWWIRDQDECSRGKDAEQETEMSDILKPEAKNIVNAWNKELGWVKFDVKYFMLQ